MQIGQASLTDTASQVAFSCLMVSMSSSWARTQKTIATSSGESELYAFERRSGGGVGPSRDPH